MKESANMSSFGARAISGAYLLLLCRPHTATPVVSGIRRKRR